MKFGLGKNYVYVKYSFVNWQPDVACAFGKLLRRKISVATKRLDERRVQQPVR
ncbi:hypothetical protein ALT1644_160023 [Alteromonas macleodii]